MPPMFSQRRPRWGGQPTTFPPEYPNWTPRQTPGVMPPQNPNWQNPQSPGTGSGGAGIFPIPGLGGWGPSAPLPVSGSAGGPSMFPPSGGSMNDARFQPPGGPMSAQVPPLSAAGVGAQGRETPGIMPPMNPGYQQPRRPGPELGPRIDYGWRTPRVEAQAPGSPGTELGPRIDMNWQNQAPYQSQAFNVGGGPTTFPPGQGSPQMPISAPMSAPPAAGQKQRAAFVDSLPLEQRDNLYAFLRQGLSFDEAYRMTMQR